MWRRKLLVPCWGRGTLAVDTATFSQGDCHTFQCETFTLQMAAGLNMMVLIFTERYCTHQ